MESTCVCGTSDGWINCALCRAGRVGRNTLSRAQFRSVNWPEPQTSIKHSKSLEDPEIYTSIDDAFSSIFQYLQTSTRKCGRYHHSNRPHHDESSDHTHYLRYHTSNFRPVSTSNPLCRTCDINVETLPGSYMVTAVREGGMSSSDGHVTKRGKEIVHRVKLEQGKAVSLSMNL